MSAADRATVRQAMSGNLWSVFRQAVPADGAVVRSDPGTAGLTPCVHRPRGRSPGWSTILTDALLASLLLAMVVMVFGNVVLRYVFNSGIVVSEELSRFCFVWLSFIGGVVAMREGTHLGMDNVVNRLPRRGQLACLAASQLLIIVCCAVLVWGTWQQHEINASNAGAGDRPVDDLDLRPRLRGGRLHRTARAARVVAHRARAHHRRRAGAGARKRRGAARSARMTVAVFSLSLLGAMALGMPIAFALLVCALALMFAQGQFDATIVSQKFLEGADSFRCWRSPSSCWPAS